jgi:hypothetical protein
MAFKIEGKVTSRIVIRTFFTSCTSGVLVLQAFLYLRCTSIENKDLHPSACILYLEFICMPTKARFAGNKGSGRQYNGPLPFGCVA